MPRAPTPSRGSPAARHTARRAPAPPARASSVRGSRTWDGPPRPGSDARARPAEATAAGARSVGERAIARRRGGGARLRPGLSSHSLSRILGMLPLEALMRALVIRVFSCAVLLAGCGLNRAQGVGTGTDDLGAVDDGFGDG